MLPIHRIAWHEWREKRDPMRVPEPCAAMADPEQVHAYQPMYEWGGPTSALLLHHPQSLSRLLRPGDVVVDLACGPGNVLLEVAALHPDCRFIGVDLSQPMLSLLEARCRELGLRNVEVRCDDICTLGSLTGQRVDAVISTSALQHLPTEADFHETLRHLLRRVPAA